MLDKNTGTINVKSVQIEVDSGFEGDDTILLIEGKIVLGQASILNNYTTPLEDIRTI